MRENCSVGCEQEGCPRQEKPEQRTTANQTPLLPQHVKFTARKMHERTCKQCIFWSYNTSTSNAICFNENLFTFWCEKENNNFYWSFSSYIMAAKGLSFNLAQESVFASELERRVPECIQGDTMTGMVAGYHQRNRKQKWLS